MSAQAYAFLSQPPAQKTRRFMVSTKAALFPQDPLPPTPVGAFHVQSKSKSIKNWIAQVQPGSPSCSPLDTTSSPSVTTAAGAQAPRRPRGLSLSSVRRASISMRTSRIPSGPLANLIASPGLEEMNPTTADFAAQGYTSFYVNLPPTTPLSAYRPLTSTDSAKQQKTSVKGKALSRIRSLSLANPRRAPSAPQDIPAVPQLVQPKTDEQPSQEDKKPRPPRTPLSPGTVLRRSKHRRAALPQNLTSELMLLQFVAGGKLTTHARAVVGEGNAVVADAQTGKVWRDCWEELEYTGLLADRASGEEDKDVERKGSDASMTIAEMMVSKPMSVESTSTATSNSSRPSTPPGSRRLDKLRPAPLNLNLPPPRIAKEVIIDVGDSIKPSIVAAVAASTAVKACVGEHGQKKPKKSISNLKGLLRGRI